MTHPCGGGGLLVHGPQQSSENVWRLQIFGNKYVQFWSGSIRNCRDNPCNPEAVGERIMEDYPANGGTNGLSDSLARRAWLQQSSFDPNPVTYVVTSLPVCVRYPFQDSLCAIFVGHIVCPCVWWTSGPRTAAKFREFAGIIPVILKP